MAAGHITPEALLLGQQCQADTLYKLVPCSSPTKQNITTCMPGLLLVLHFVLLLVFAINPQQDPNISCSYRNCDSSCVGQWWGLQELVV